MIGLIISMYSTIIASQVMGFQYKEHGVLITFVSIVVSVLIIFLYVKMKKGIRKALHRTIPNTLK